MPFYPSFRTLLDIIAHLMPHVYPKTSNFELSLILFYYQSQVLEKWYYSSTNCIYLSELSRLVLSNFVQTL